MQNKTRGEHWCVGHVRGWRQSSCLCLAVCLRNSRASGNSPVFLIKLGYFLSVLYSSFTISLFVSSYLFLFSASLVLLPHPRLDDPALDMQTCNPNLFACPVNSCQACTFNSRSLLWARKCCWAKGLGALKTNIPSHTNFTSYDSLPSVGDLLKISSHVQYEQSPHLASLSFAWKVWDLLLFLLPLFPSHSPLTSSESLSRWLFAIARLTQQSARINVHFFFF